MAPNVPNRLKIGPKDFPHVWSAPLYLILGGFRPFWVRNQPQKGFNSLLFGFQIDSNLSQMAPKLPQNDSQTTLTVLYSCGTLFVHYLGAFRSFLGEERVENQPKTLNFVNIHVIVFNFEWS